MIKQSDQAAQQVINQALEQPQNTEEELILQVTQRLLDVYSFSENQTYPRPSHPEIEKQRDVYFTLVAILISLRTTLENEKRAVQAFLEKYQSPAGVLSATVEEIAETIKVAGMPDKKATAIIKATQYVIDVLGNDWSPFTEIPIDEAREKLMEIPGVGPKSADCLLELGLDLPTIVIDVNMLRVVARLFNLKGAEKPDLGNMEQLENAKKQIESTLRKDGFLYQIVHTMLLLHGKNVCKAIPKCEVCQFQDKCAYFRQLSGGKSQLRMFEI